MTQAFNAVTHGRSLSTEYAIWKGMLHRCRSPRYKNYHGRGIKVCKRWLKFENFLADMGERPPGLTLERKNNDQGYSKKNCVWATRKVQSRNTRIVLKIEHNGQTLSLGEWAEILGKPRSTLWNRLFRAGMSPKEAFL